MRTFAIALATTFLLAACGFQLRGAAPLPFDTLYMTGTSAGIGLDLKRNIQAGTRTTVIDDAKKAEAVLELLQELREKKILSLAATGRVREFQLIYRVDFRVHDGKGGEFLPVSTVQLTRDMSFNDTDVLAKDTEEALLFRDMRFDMVQLILRRLAGSQRPKPPSQ